MTRSSLIYLITGALIIFAIIVYVFYWNSELYNQHLRPLINSNCRLDFKEDHAKYPDLYHDNGNRIKRHVFFDLGTNNGDSIKYFILPVSKPSNTMHGYGAKNNTKWEIYAFEANPRFEEDLNKLKIEYEQKGHNFNLYIKSAAWIADEKLTFYLDTVNPGANYWGSSLDDTHPDVIRSNKTKVIVDGYDISKLIRRYSEDDVIIVKIDIEGTEYKLLTHFLTHDTYKYIDMIAVEFHKFLEPIPGTINFFEQSFKMFNLTFINWW